MHIPVHVLVVDDEEDVQWLFKQNFRRAIKAGRLAFHFVFSGEEALAYLRTSNTPNIVLVLSDINMPGMTGLELLHTIKHDFEGLPVHMITAYGNDETRRQAMAEGADGFLTKPLDFERLKETLAVFEG